MNGMILQTPTESKDIKFSSKKGVDTKSEESENLFEDLIASLVDEEGKSQNSSFLLGKLLNLSSDFANKGKTISEFSKGDLLPEEEEGAFASLEELFKIALSLKNGESVSTDSPTLKVALEDKSVITQFKEATTIKELLKIADKNGIKVKNFEFFMPQSALNPNDKKIVQKITSEDIFKIVDQKQTIKETPRTQSALIKVISQELQQDKTFKGEEQTTLTSLLSKDSQLKKATKTDKVVATLAGEATKKVVTDKTISSKEEIPKSVEKKTSHEKTSLELETEQETFQRIKPQKTQTNTLATLLKSETDPKELKTQQVQVSTKDEILTKPENEAKEMSVEKSTPQGDIKSDMIHKSKEPHDVKKTFNTFAMEFKEKVEAYKPPMMKVNMQLSPKNLGDVDVTLITRGNNLQVTINSNSQNTLVLFVQNQAEFKNSLVNMGFSDLQMNFGDKRGEEKNQHQQQKDDSSSDYHDSLENEEEGLSMVLPHYV